MKTPILWPIRRGAYAQGIDKQVAQHLRYTIRVGLGKRKVIWDLRGEVYVLRFGRQAQVVNSVSDDLSDFGTATDLDLLSQVARGDGPRRIRKAS